MDRPGRSLGAVLLVGAGIAVAPLLALIGRSWPRRVAVSGHSMEPTLRSGDWLLVDPLSYRQRLPQNGDLAVVHDPRQPGRWIVKRVAAVDRAGNLRLAGDHAGHRTEDASLGAVPASAVLGRPWLRYWPLRRIGRVG